MAILIKIKGNNPITIINNISVDEIKNNAKLLVCGYPGILCEDMINQRICFNCENYDIFPENKIYAAYRIKDDYHYYYDMNDKNILAGLSGSPIFIFEDNSYSLVGINKSISVIDDGKNPFKIVYYIKIKEILRYLYEKNVIIYERNGKENFDIIWVFNEGITNKNYIPLLLVGGSGAGKSSIIRQLGLHKKIINSTNDGQTTRNNVYYHYALNAKDEKMIINFYDSDLFVKDMKNKLSKDELFDLYKIYCDLDEKIKNYNDFMWHYYDDINNEDDKDIIYLKILKDNITGENIEQEYINKSLRTSQYQIFCKAFDYYREKKKDREKFKKIDNEKAKKIYEKLKKIRGFFKIDEFEFLIENNSEDEDYYNLTDVEIESEKEGGINFKKSAESLTFDRMISNMYSCMYKKIYVYLEKYLIANSNNYIKYDKNNNKLEIKLNDNLDIDSVNLITYTLQVFKDGFLKDRSLTGVIRKVEVYDRIAPSYAKLLYDRRISELLIVDTCGLDHLSTMDNKYMTDYLYDTYDDVKNMTNGFVDGAIVYVKKMDSGKPDEFRKISNYFEKIMPGVQYYLMLTGTDIFYRKDVQIKNYDLKRSKYSPKIVNELSGIVFEE